MEISPGQSVRGVLRDKRSSGVPAHAWPFDNNWGRLNIFLTVAGIDMKAHTVMLGMAPKVRATLHTT